MATFLVAHGAWTGGWFWRRMHRALAALGHELHAPTLTGVGDRRHLAHSDVGLETHITDLLQVMEMEDLDGVTLLAHSYGGMVATAVADRARDRLGGLVYLDAFVPSDGQCLLDLLPPEARARMLEAARSGGDGWRVPPNPMPPDTAEADVAWADARRTGQPLKTFTQPVRLSGSDSSLPTAYIYCTRAAPGDVFRQFATRAQAEATWRYIELDSSHNPHVTAPQPFAALLAALATAAP